MASRIVYRPAAAVRAAVAAAARRRAPTTTTSPKTSTATSPPWRGRGGRRAFVASARPSSAAATSADTAAAAADAAGPTTTTAGGGGPIVPGVGRGKTSTGLVGLPVDHDAVPKMIVKYQALLDKMAASDMPPAAEYRKVVTAICNHRIDAARSNPHDPERVEELCNCGQVEELVQQADDEMTVLDMYLRERWWEYVKDAPVEFSPMEEGEEDREVDGVDWEAPMEKNEEGRAADARRAAEAAAKK